MNKVLISACLLGVECRYDGKSKPCKKAIELLRKEHIIPVCPEQLGGLPTPRIPSEVMNGEGKEVLMGKNKVINKKGQDVTKYFIKGAKETLRIAKITNSKTFIGKSKSPSCGLSKTYDGTFSNTLTKGDGVTVALFKKNNIKVITEKDIII